MIKKILYHPDFLKKFKQLDQRLQVQALKAEKIFRESPFHPSLRLHALHGDLRGDWSISVNRRVRMVYRLMENGDIVFISIGTHDIYR